MTEKHKTTKSPASQSKGKNDKETQKSTKKSSSTESAPVSKKSSPAVKKHENVSHQDVHSPKTPSVKKQKIEGIDKGDKKILVHGRVPRVRIIVKSFDYTVVDEAARSILETAERGGSLVSGPIPLPTKIKKFTVNRSFFVHKNARDQYEMRIHKRLLDIKEPTPQTIESLQNLSLPAGVDIEIKMM